MDAQTATTLRCPACGALASASCLCGLDYVYISPGKLAADAVKANPEKSDRAIAEELGIGNKTVSRARATVSNDTVDDKRIGLDGRKRGRPKGSIDKTPRKKREPKAPGVKQAQRSIDLDADTWEQVKLRAAEANMPAAAFIGALLTATINPEIDLKTLSKTAQDKVGVAIRQATKRLEREFEERVRNEYTARVKKNFPYLDEMQERARNNESIYREYLQKAKKAMTVEEFTLVCSLLHPDSRASASEERLRRAFQMFKPKKFALTGEK